MSLLYSSTFTQSLDRLSSNEQKQVKITAIDLMLDPRGNGLQLHRIEKSDGFWTARVSQDIRLVLHKDGEQTLIAYVGHHDAAYRWAERRRLLRHERTGAMQLVEIIESTQEQLVIEPAGLESAEPVALHRPFAELTEEQLLDVGVPREWLHSVRAADEASVDGIFSLLPAEAAEALLDYVTGGRLEDHLAPVSQPGADPFAHPDARRRFRTVEHLEELKAALDAPFAQWAVFLHPTQRATVAKRWSGPTRISGSAGTGKTIVALHRANHIARSPGARVLLTTFSKPLASSLAAKVEVMTAADPTVRSRLQIMSLDDAALRLYSERFELPRMVADADIRQAIGEAREEGLGGQHSDEFLFEEWAEVVDAWSIHQSDDYATVPRLGRKTRLGPRQRQEAWQVFTYVRERLTKRGLTSWADLYHRLSGRDSMVQFPYTHVVVDEAQDLSVAQTRWLAATCSGQPESLFFTGDLGQRIFNLPFSWLKLGIDVRGRSTTLKVCYRTSHQIREIADRLLPSVIQDQDGVAEVRRGTISVFDGAVPRVELSSNSELETSLVARCLTGWHADGIGEDEVAVLVRSARQIGRANLAIGLSGLRIQPLTMHEAKGLEFRAVAVMALDEDVLPDPDRLANVSDFADLEAIQDTERHLLYVAATRARDHLLLSGVAPGSEFLDDLAA